METVPNDSHTQAQQHRLVVLHRYWLLAASLAAALIGGISAIFVLKMNSVIGVNSVLSFAGILLGAFLTSAFFWWLTITRKRKASLWRGFFYGILTGVFVHPVVFLFSAIITVLAYAPGSENWEETLISLPLLALTLSLVSMVLFGWITALIGAVAGAILGGLARLTTKFAE